MVYSTFFCGYILTNDPINGITLQIDVKRLHLHLQKNKNAL